MMSAGSKLGDSVLCPYHSWRFGADGSVRMYLRSQTCEFQQRPESMHIQHWNVTVGFGPYWATSLNLNVPLYQISIGSMIRPSEW